MSSLRPEEAAPWAISCQGKRRVGGGGGGGGRGEGGGGREEGGEQGRGKRGEEEKGVILKLLITRSYVFIQENDITGSLNYLHLVPTSSPSHRPPAPRNGYWMNEGWGYVPGV